MPTQQIELEKINTDSLELHPLCTLFPRLSGAEFEALRDDIAANGLRQPIVTHNGMILDGGNRYAACIAANVVPQFVEFVGADIGAFVLSANMHRRHLSPGQQAAIVASVQSWGAAQPASRPKKAGNVAGLSTVADRAAQSGASERTQRMADKVAKTSPDLARQVAHGEISLPKAVQKIATQAEQHPRDADSNAESAISVPLDTGNENVQENKESSGGTSSDPEHHFVPLAEYEAALENARNLAYELESYMEADKGTVEAAKTILKLKGQIATVASQRDQYMTTCNELKRQVKAQQREIDRLKKQVAKP